MLQTSFLLLHKPFFLFIIFTLINLYTQNIPDTPDRRLDPEKKKLFIISFPDFDYRFWNCTFYENEYIRDGFLYENTSLDVGDRKIAFLKNSYILFYSNGSPARGYLARPAQFNISNTVYRFSKKDMVSFTAEGVLIISTALTEKFNIITAKGDIRQVKKHAAYGIDLNTQYTLGRTALYTAAMYNHPGIISFLLSKKADPHISDIYGNTPLGVAVRNGNKGSVKVLIKQGVIPVVSNFPGSLPLHVYAVTGDVKKISETISNGADLNEKNIDGNTPLALAVWAGNNAAVNLLIQKGGSLNRVAETNSVSNVFSNVFSTLPDIPIAAIPVSNVLRSGKTPIMYTAIKGDIVLFFILLHAGADIYTKDAENRTVLDYARLNYRRIMIERLQDKIFDDSRKKR